MQPTTPQPLWTVTPEKIQEAVRWIVQAAHPRKIILFGSHARGDARGDSDVDLLVVTGPMSEPERVREMARLRDVLSPLRMPVDVLVAPESKLAYWRDTPGNVYFEASEDGKVLYEPGQ